MPERKYVAQSSYRYGFNGKENDIEVKGEDNQQDYGMRIYDPRVGRFLSIDPLTKSYPWYTPYQFAGNQPIVAIDLDGAEPLWNTSDFNKAIKNSEVELHGKTEGERQFQISRKGAAVGSLVGIALGLDWFLFKGKATQTVLSIYSYAQLANSYEHNRATTPEARTDQKRRTRNALADALIGYGTGKGVGVLSKIVTEGGQTVYKTFQSTSIRFSQKSIDMEDYFDVLTSMRKHGYDPSKAIDIVKMKDGMYTSLDNTRLMAAQDAGVNIKAVVHNFDDPLDAATKERAFSQYKKEINTWGEYIETRASSQGSKWKNEFSSGSFNQPVLKLKKK